MSDEREIMPGERRLERIRAEHGMPVRQSPVAIGVLAGGALGTLLGVDPAALVGLVRGGLADAASLHVPDGAAVLRACIASAAAVAWPSLACGAAGGAVGALVQTGFRVRVPSLRMPSLRAPRVAAMGGPVRVAWALALLAAAACAVAADWTRIAALPAEPTRAAVASAASVVLDAVLAALGAGVLFSMADVLVARVRWQRAVRMTAAEARDERRGTDGDPGTRSRRRSVARRMHAGMARGRELRGTVA